MIRISVLRLRLEANRKYRLEMHLETSRKYRQEMGFSNLIRILSSVELSCLVTSLIKTKINRKICWNFCSFGQIIRHYNLWITLQADLAIRLRDNCFNSTENWPQWSFFGTEVTERVAWGLSKWRKYRQSWNAKNKSISSNSRQIDNSGAFGGTRTIRPLRLNSRKDQISPKSSLYPTKSAQQLTKRGSYKKIIRGNKSNVSFKTRGLNNSFKRIALRL